MGCDMWAMQSRLLNLTLDGEVAVAETPRPRSPCTICFGRARQSNAKPSKLFRIVKDSTDAKKEVGKIPTASKATLLNPRLCTLSCCMPAELQNVRVTILTIEFATPFPNFFDSSNPPTSYML